MLRERNKLIIIANWCQTKYKYIRPQFTNVTDRRTDKQLSTAILCFAVTSLNRSHSMKDPTYIVRDDYCYGRYNLQPMSVNSLDHYFRPV